MKTLFTGAVAASVLISFSIPAFAQMPEMPKPEKEHEWLKKLVGNWIYDADLTMEPGKPPMQTSGTETGRSIGDFWTVSEIKGDMMGVPFIGLMTLGYDSKEKHYVGTWIASVQNQMMQYIGSVDAGGKTLSLKTQGPCPMQGGKVVKIEETIEITGPDTKTMTSKVDFDGKWVTMMTAKYRRVK